jgi:hypothetical protein
MAKTCYFKPKSEKFMVFSPQSVKLTSGNVKLPQLAKNDEKLPR